MGCSSSLPLEQRVVVVGGGYAGINLCAQLSKAGANYTLIDPTDSFNACIPAVRAIVDANMIPRLYIDYKTSFGDHFKQGRVVAIDTANKQVTMESGENVGYDILVIATGSSSPFPAKNTDLNKADGEKAYQEYYEKVKESKKIVIVGGGFVGTEISAELKTEYPDKSVTIVHPTDNLVAPELSDKFQKKLRSIIQVRMGVDLVLGDKVTNLSDLDQSPATVQLSSGKSLEADLVISCIGTKVNSAAYKDGLESSMNEHGALKVNEYLQVSGHEEIFAIGDCSDVAEAKLGYNAEKQAEFVFKTLKSMVTTPGAKLKPYAKDSMPIKGGAISLGRKSGIAETKGGSVLPEFVITKLKSGDMASGKVWSTMQQKPPKY